MGNKSGVLAFDVSCACLCQLSACPIALHLHSVCVPTSIPTSLASVLPACLCACLLADARLFAGAFGLPSPHTSFQSLPPSSFSDSFLTPPLPLSSHGSFPISLAPPPPPHLNTHTQPPTTSPPPTLCPATALSPSPARSCLSLWTCSWPPTAWPLPAFDRCTRLATPLHAIRLSHSASSSA